MATQFRPVFSAPSPTEAEAMITTAAYLKRAGNEAATRLMGLYDFTDTRSELIKALRDDMCDSAALCECLLALFDGWLLPSEPAKAS